MLTIYILQLQFSTILLLGLMVFPQISSELRLEITLRDKSGSAVKAQIMCAPMDKNIPYSKDQHIWWKGSKLGNEERNRLRQEIPKGTFIPDIKVNSNENYKCFLMSPESNIDKDHLRKRIHREIAESIPAEFGNCSPGYRLHQDKCFPCPKGTFTSGQESNCNLCPENFYNSKEAADSCYPCPEAKKTLSEGADSQDLCVYTDTSGRPVSSVSTKLIVIAVCATIFIVVAWILIGLYLFWWWKEKKGKLKEEDGGEKGGDEDHIYSEIKESSSSESADQDADGYEVPKKSDRDNTYTEILPDGDGYEEPIKPSYDDHIYETIKEDKDNNVLEDSKDPAVKKSSDRTQALDNDYYYVNKGSKMVIRKTSKGKQREAQKLIDVNFDELYANADAIPKPREHREHLPKTESYGFQPLLSPEEDRLQIKKSDYNQLAKIILRNSKSESDAWAGNQAPNLEELGYDVEKLSKVIEEISEKTGPYKTSEELLELASQTRIDRRISESFSKISKAELLRNVLMVRKDHGLRAEDFEFKKRYEKDEEQGEIDRPSSGRVSSDTKARKSISLPTRISIAISDESDADADISVDTDTES